MRRNEATFLTHTVSGMFEQVEKKMCEEEIVQRSRENDFRSFAEPKVAKAI